MRPEIPVTSMSPSTTSSSADQVYRFLGTPIHALTMEQVLAKADTAITGRRSLHIGVVNAAKLVNMQYDPELAKAVLESDLILADGMAVVWACRLLGQHVPERVPGIDLMERLLERSAERGYRVYCLGATEEVLGRAIQRMRERFPGVQITGQHHGYFSAEDEHEVITDIVRSQADILFVAMTSPKKEHFLARWSDRMAVPICHGVGGSFDVWAGKVRRAPVYWQKMGLEWLYRVIQEPRRMFRRYAKTNVLFCGLLLRELFRIRVLKRPCPTTGH